MSAASWMGITIPKLDPALTLRGDPVRDRATGAWITVHEIVEGVVVGETFNVKEGTIIVTAPVERCTPSWNPKCRCFGRVDAADREKFWLPVERQLRLF